MAFWLMNLMVGDYSCNGTRVSPHDSYPLDQGGIAPRRDSH